MLAHGLGGQALAGVRQRGKLVEESEGRLSPGARHRRRLGAALHRLQLPPQLIRLRLQLQQPPRLRAAQRLNAVLRRRPHAPLRLARDAAQLVRARLHASKLQARGAARQRGTQAAAQRNALAWCAIASRFPSSGPLTALLSARLQYSA